MEGHLRIFISAVSSEFRSFREAVGRVLETRRILPIVQENFPPDYRKVRAKLKRLIRDADAVICLVGFAYGTEPSERSDQEPRYSYTQLEYHIARELGKRVFVFLSDDHARPCDQVPDEDEERRRLQLAHREVVASGDESREAFTTQTGLALRVALIPAEDIAREPRTQTVGDVSEHEESLFEEHSSCTPACSTDRFHELISQYNDNLPTEFRQCLLQEIMLCAWAVLVDRPPYLASKLLSKRHEIEPAIARLVIPLCKVSVRNPGDPLSAREVSDFLRLLQDDARFPPATESWARKILMVRMVRFIFYNQHSQSSIVESADFRQELAYLADRKEVFWEEFFTDLYLRYMCNFIVMDEPLLSIVKPVYDRYLSNTNAPLSQLCRLVLCPTETAAQHALSETEQMLTRIATQCRTLIECRWCISALLRIVPLYSSSEEELDYTNMLRSLIKAFSSPVRSRYPQLQFVYLKALLGRFMRTKDLQSIKDFEDGFLKWLVDCGHNPSLMQLCHLQLEYASCLYACCCHLKSEIVQQLTFGALILNRTKLIDHRLLHNPLLIPTCSLQANPGLRNRRELCRWLIEYTSGLWRLYAGPLIRENHLRVLQFKASTHVYKSQSLFCPSVLASLRDHDPTKHDCHASYYAKSTGVLTFIPRNQHVDLIRRFVRRAIQADDYAVMRNARHIAHCLYSCYYYGGPAQRTEIIALAESFGQRTAIGTSEVPKMHWAYYAGLKYAARSNEMQFLDDLSACSSDLEAMARQQSFRTVEGGARFSGAIISLSNVYSSMDSYFARVLLSGLMNSPELWNLFGTTVSDNATENDAASCEKAARFYYFAMCFARSRKDDDQKYFYNWARSQGLAYKISRLSPETGYLKEVASYVREPFAKFFAYRDECVRPYLDVLNDRWDEIPSEARQFIQDKLSRARWVKEQIRSADLHKLSASLCGAE